MKEVNLQSNYLPINSPLGPPVLVQTGAEASHDGEIKVETRGERQSLLPMYLIGTDKQVQMRKKLFIFLFSLSQCCIHAQRAKVVDSLKTVINQQKWDTAEVNALAQLAFEQEQFDSAFKYARQGLSLAKRINDKKGRSKLLLDSIEDKQQAKQLQPGNKVCFGCAEYL